MKSFYRIILFLILFLLSSTNIALAASSTIPVNLIVEGCNNNSICEPSNGETVLSCPNDCAVIPPPPPPHGGGGYTQFIHDVVITLGVDKAVIDFKTQSPTFATVTWGETSEVKNGSMRSIVFVTDHSAVLTGLKPGTQYFFLIVVEGRTNSIGASYSSNFTTISFPEEYHIPNPSNVRALVGQQGITLRWSNPIDQDFDYIRIMKSGDRFRSSPFTGTLVYEGGSEYFLDKNVVIGQTYYYTLFTRETSGEFSSGVGVKVFFNLQENTPVVLPPPPIKSKDFLPHFLVIQKGQVISPIGNIREVTSTDTISAQSTSKTFEGFSDLWLEITTPSKTDARAYLFIYNSQNKTYQTSIPPLGQEGDYEVRIYGFNKDHTVLLSEGILRVEPSTQTQTPRGGSNTEALAASFLLVVLLACIIWLKKKTEL
ncbi:MAG: hypothetical protein AAB477_01410 [Patescibacteria group bacterium]